MNTPWRVFLENALCATESPMRGEGTGFCGLPGYGLLRVSGEDAENFLQGQLTADVKALLPGRGGFGALCTPKGRVISSFHLLRSDRLYYFLLPADLSETVRTRLQTYVLRSRVTLENLTPERGFLGLLGSGPESFAGDEGLAFPDTPGTWLDEADTLAFRLDDGSKRCLIAAPTARAVEIWSRLSRGNSLVDSEAWRLADIKAGLPEVVPGTTGEFLPQMLNLDVLGGIGFQKGCYTGQEIVTRTHYLGQIKRRMFHLRCRTESAPYPGTPVFDAFETEPLHAGMVVLAARADSENFDLLAVLGIESSRRGRLRVFRPDGPPAEVLPLPYSVDLPRGQQPEAQKD